MPIRSLMSGLRALVRESEKTYQHTKHTKKLYYNDLSDEF